ncbi:MAG: hypothetical protein PUJ36_06805, partial [bacterium]|nr:hypothetical protein [bacterium]
CLQSACIKRLAATAAPPVRSEVFRISTFIPSSQIPQSYTILLNQPNALYIIAFYDSAPSTYRNQ